VKYGIYMKLA